MLEPAVNWQTAGVSNDCILRSIFESGAINFLDPQTHPPSKGEDINWKNYEEKYALWENSKVENTRCGSQIVDRHTVSLEICEASARMLDGGRFLNCLLPEELDSNIEVHSSSLQMSAGYTEMVRGMVSDVDVNKEVALFGQTSTAGENVHGFGGNFSAISLDSYTFSYGRPAHNGDSHEFVIAPLERAAAKANSEIIKCLLDHQSISTESFPRPEFDIAIEAAAYYGHPKATVQLIGAAGIDIDIPSDTHYLVIYEASMIIAALQNYFSKNCTHMKVLRGKSWSVGDSALEAAVECQMAEFIQALADASVDIRRPDFIKKARRFRLTESLKLLPELDPISDSSDHTGPLTWAGKKMDIYNGPVNIHKGPDIHVNLEWLGRC
ncbi:hypothetical protein B0O99DRAFT_682190 [Bisporella sp. PMI_857]|nr:hypothetical protein B0O99DRAFT_682190 [Bisporella sp. PMI_857]